MVRNPSRGNTTRSPITPILETTFGEEQNSENWDSPIDLDFFKNGEHQQFQTTQGRLYTLLWKGNVEVLSQTTPPPLPQTANDILRILRISQNQHKSYYRAEYEELLADQKIRNALHAISGRISQLNELQGNKYHQFIYPFDLLDNASNGKQEKIFIALRNKPSIDRQIYSTHDLDVPYWDSYSPTTRLSVFLIPLSLSEDGLAELLKPILYVPNQKPSASQQRFKLNLHGIFVNHG